MRAHKPDLSVIIPLLNEQNTLTELVHELLDQRDIALEIILVDGGSRDGSYKRCCQLAEKHPDRINCLQTQASRPIQMNLGASYARAKDLLFLHADTQLKDTMLLRHALDALNQQREQQPHHSLAGHFPLQFIRSLPGHERAYYFYEAKTYLNRPDTINGDQGILLSKIFFHQLCQFDESLPYMEDARLAKKIFQHGHWITLPGVVYSSARRFEREGLKQRQILNSFLCNFDHIGLQEFFREAQQAYRTQDQTAPLQLRPFLSIIHRLMMYYGVFPRWRRWYHTGGYIASNAWQLAFASDCKHAQQSGKSPAECVAKRLALYDRWLAPFINTAPSRALTGILTMVWFYSLFLTNKSITNKSITTKSSTNKNKP